MARIAKVGFFHCFFSTRNMLEPDEYLVADAKGKENTHFVSALECLHKYLLQLYIQ